MTSSPKGPPKRGVRVRREHPPPNRHATPKLLGGPQVPRRRSRETPVMTPQKGSRIIASPFSKFGVSWADTQHVVLELSPALCIRCRGGQIVDANARTRSSMAPHAPAPICGSELPPREAV